LVKMKKMIPNTNIKRNNNSYVAVFIEANRNHQQLQQILPKEYCD